MKRSYIKAVIILIILFSSPSTALFAKNIIICIDGTNNDPNDSIEEYDKSGLLEDNGISNVLKLHLLMGGRLDNRTPNPEQHAFYYVGVGNRGATSVYRLASAAFAITEPGKILEHAYLDLAKTYQQGDSVFIFGFSRGAAIARWLAQHINDNGLEIDKTIVADKVTIDLLGVWDTVAAFKGVNLDKDNDPDSREVREKKGRIAENIRIAYHLVSIDDPRLAFRPVLMGAEKRVNEIWFPGVHSDVGGGYREDGLSDIALEFMLEKAEEAGIKLKDLDKIDYEAIAPVRRQDLIVEPDPVGKLHLQSVIDDKAYVAWLQKRNWKDIMAPRNIYVAKENHRSNIPPVIHFSVLERKKQLGFRYNPPNLMKLNDNYRILNRDGLVVDP